MPSPQPEITLRFTATIQIRGINPYVLVTERQAAGLRANWRKPMPVLVKVNGRPAEPWHINMMPAGDGSFYLYLHGEVRQASGTKVGDKVAVELVFDTEYRNGPLHTMPPWFHQALTDRPAAQANWEKLPPSRQKDVLRYLAGLKTTAAQVRNTERAIQALSGAASHFLGRDWRDGA